ncbi:GWxTD domain-containing protein [Fulvivirga sediminis]|uniref:GWxTD domain-containing protein n=1 Tax=Fulvivirga sediminis TaxID=2803949 RepID=A0A937JWY5_9BACT|nr:GWxTD domain-containing protein [Fulvivirga sediminis]MBL3654968.1 GWxTD domain-containing protein [Fulvivirga sediminis]
MRLFSILLFTIFTWFQSYAQSSLSKVNFAFKYNPDNEIETSQKAYIKQDYIEYNLLLKVNKQYSSIKDYDISFFSTSSTHDALTPIPNLHIDTLNINTVKNSYNYQLTFPKEIEGDIIVAQILSKSSGFTYFSYVRPTDDVPFKYFMPGQTFKDWLPTGLYSINYPDNLFAFYYDNNFPPALPPMPSSSSEPPKAMEIDSIISINSNQLLLGQKGLYLIQQDTTSAIAVSFRVEDKYYPKMVRIEDLVIPLRYITTKEEYEDLLQVNGDKKKFDQFWLDLTNSPERAKLIIKKYYQRTQQANYFFTSYKEGWKTDMGMIYMIYGMPDEVKLTNDGEDWLYKATPQLPSQTFKFINAQNIFSDKNFALIRERKHAANWYRAIDLWRKGRL